jgi:hypothetical protein
MKAKHTPGPWLVGVGAGHCFHEGNRVAIVGHDDSSGEVTEFTIAEVWSTSDDSDIADGHLIAAAPELLAALEEALRIEQSSGQDWQPWAEAARSAVTKARGQS